MGGNAAPKALARFESDLSKLVQDGSLLEAAMVLEIYDKGKLREALGTKESDDIDALIESLPNFRTGYESWYSEALVVIRVLLPERLEDFKSLYEVPKGRKLADYGNYTLSDYLIGLKSTRGYDTVVDRTAGLPKLQRQTAILASVQKRFKSSLFEIKSILQADLFDSELSAANELLKKGFCRGAGAIAGVVLEGHLQEVSANHQIKFRKKSPTISDFNNGLKEAEVISVSQWRFISLLGDYRNLCDHKKPDDPSHSQVRDLIDGVEKVLKTIA